MFMASSRGYGFIPFAHYAFALSCALLFSTPSYAQDARQSKPPVSEIEAVVRDYILKNPEIIIEALEILEERRASAQFEHQKQLIDTNKQTLLASEHQTVLGNPQGDVTLIEFFDYNCGFCRQSLQPLKQLLEEDRNLRVVLKEFPILGPESQEASRVAIAASKIDPEKYLQLHVRMLQSPGQANERIALLIAEDLGFDMEKLREVMKAPAIDEAIGEVYGLATELGLSGTPTFIIGSEVIPGAIGHDALREKVDSMRKCGETVCS